MTPYDTFLASKRQLWTGAGKEAGPLSSQLFPWQAALVRWAVKKGRAALFADCGLGKTPMQLAWAQATGERTLILAPLCVAEQTVREGAKFGIPVHYAADQADVGDHQIAVTNYERLEKFDPAIFGAIVLDESSILKAFDGKTRTKLIQAFAATRFRLCCTATPAPNDIAELANHAEFLGLMTRPEFLATWFVRIQEGHRTTEHHGWRMKRHAVVPFYRWMASWAMAVRTPSDLGYPDDGFVLPALRIRERIVSTEILGDALFPELGMVGLSGRLRVRRGSLTDRILATENLVDEWGHQWIVWCGLNAESQALGRALPGAVEVQGSDGYAEKVGAVLGFCEGRIRILVSKVRILGYGLNFQQCSRMVFVGLGDSYEQYYQAIRRCWRFGQTQPVDVWIVVSEAERLIIENVRQKEARAQGLAAKLLAHMRDCEREEVWGQAQPIDSSKAIALT